jgi:hypothetical protein
MNTALRIAFYSMIAALLGCLFCFGCGKDKATTSPQNNAPQITAVSATPNPIPRNQTADLSVVASDPDGDALTYSWTTSGGLFAGGNTSAHVVWVPPQTPASYQATVTVSDGKTDVDTTINITVTSAAFSLGGQVRNQSDAAATDLYVVIENSSGYLDSTLTSSNGNYSFSNVPEGQLTVTLRSTEVITYVLPRYFDKDTLIALNGNTVLNFNIREFNLIFYDDGTMASQWNIYGGVRNDGNKYIFENQLFVEDHMMMSAWHLVPANADPSNLYFMVYGEAAPSDSSRLLAYVSVDGVDQGVYWNMVYKTNPRYYIGTFEGLDNVVGNHIQLDFEFEEWDATYIYAHEIWVFNY